MRALVLAALLVGACAGRPVIPAGPNSSRIGMSATTVYVSCMAEPPPLVVIDWPDADSIGNVLMHASTVDRVRGAYADLRKWVDLQYFACLHVAERAQESVTVEIDP